ncbi:MAG: class I SAM-dependent methyltransferase [Gammaproteobacteria bacterium]
MSLAEYRNSENERARVADLMRLVPDHLETALDIGARDGFIAEQLASKVSAVTALDLETPTISDERIRCIKGDITSLDLPNNSYELALCAEVLEHIPPDKLTLACTELTRVSSRYLLIGVPYKQDTRVGRTTCQTCGQKNPPWGHVNSFSKSKLQALFNTCNLVEVSYIGKSKERTNSLSCWLMDLAGNPYGTYSQDEPCIHCGATIGRPCERKLYQRVFTKIAFLTQRLQNFFLAEQPNWVHILFEKKSFD